MFLEKVDAHGFSRSACWQWLGAGKGNGYGHVRRGSKNEGAHRESYRLFVGEIPDGMDVCHKCDNRWCVNPSHLFIATRAGNMADMVHKGRGAGGNKKHLKESQVQEVRRRLRAGVPAREVGETMGIGYATITAIARGGSYVGIG